MGLPPEGDQPRQRPAGGVGHVHDVVERAVAAEPPADELLFDDSEESGAEGSAATGPAEDSAVEEEEEPIDDEADWVSDDGSDDVAMSG